AVREHLSRLQPVLRPHSWLPHPPFSSPAISDIGDSPQNIQPPQVRLHTSRQAHISFPRYSPPFSWLFQLAPGTMWHQWLPPRLVAAVSRPDTLPGQLKAGCSLGPGAPTDSALVWEPLAGWAPTVQSGNSGN